MLKKKFKDQLTDKFYEQISEVSLNYSIIADQSKSIKEESNPKKEESVISSQNSNSSILQDSNISSIQPVENKTEHSTTELYANQSEYNANEKKVLDESTISFSKKEESHEETVDAFLKNLLKMNISTKYRTNENNKTQTTYSEKPGQKPEKHKIFRNKRNSKKSKYIN